MATKALPVERNTQPEERRPEYMGISNTQEQAAQSSELQSLDYEVYLDKIYGGWLGKSIGGTIGARFEGNKNWLEVSREDLFPDEIPPNDDLDLQILWLKVLEEKGPHFTSGDLAEAWLENCWYPFCEYGIFRRNWRLGIHPPMSGRYGNQLWEHGMGCPIRSEIWGYINPGNPEEAARMAQLDGQLDHGEQSVGAERLLSAMAASAFFESDLRALAERHLHYLPSGTSVEAGVRIVFDAYDAGLSLHAARQRLIALSGVPEACDARINVPIIFLGLLYGQGDMERTMQATLHCGYDVDCSMATVGALLGQVYGASNLPASLRDPIGDKLVMGIAYEREEMTISALARDTARVGVLINANTPCGIKAAPSVAPFPETAKASNAGMAVTYAHRPVAAPGEQVVVELSSAGSALSANALSVQPVDAADGWTISPSGGTKGQAGCQRMTLTAPAKIEKWPQKNLFEARWEGNDRAFRFGVAGAGIWHLLGMHFHLDAPADVPDKPQREWHHHFASLDRDYIDEANLDAAQAFKDFSALIGKPALVYSYENELDPDQLLQLGGTYCLYAARIVHSPIEQDLHLVIGNTDSFRILLNGGFVGERDEHVWWTPQNNSYFVHLNQGANILVVKLLKFQGADFRFTLGFRKPSGPKQALGQHFVDWSIDLADGLLDA